MKTPVLILFFLATVALVLLIVNITISNMLATSGIALNNIQTRLASLQHDDTLMEEKILKISSYSNIASEAATLGFVPENKIVTFSNPIYTLAYQQ